MGGFEKFASEENDNMTIMTNDSVIFWARNR